MQTAVRTGVCSTKCKKHMQSTQFKKYSIHLHGLKATCVHHCHEKLPTSTRTKADGGLRIRQYLHCLASTPSLKLRTTKKHVRKILSLGNGPRDRMMIIHDSCKHATFGDSTATSCFGSSATIRNAFSSYNFLSP